MIGSIRSMAIVVGYNSKDAVRTPPGSPTNSRLPAQGYPQQAGNSKDAVRTPPSPDQGSCLDFRNFQYVRTNILVVGNLVGCVVVIMRISC